MKAEEYDELSAIEQLRLLVSNFNHCNETFNQSYTLDELVKIHRALVLSEWDILPDSWEERQIQEAIKLDRSPTWDDGEYPTYDAATSFPGIEHEMEKK